MTEKSERSVSNFLCWGNIGKVAFVFSVLWLFGLLFNVMMLGLFVVGAGLLGYQGYKRFSGQTVQTKQASFRNVLEKIQTKEPEVTPVVETEKLSSQEQAYQDFLIKFGEQGGEKNK